jgi:hypothetical protein
MSKSASAEAIRQRIQGWRDAEARERRERATARPLDPEESLQAAIELNELLPDASVEDDAVRAREVDRARAAWMKLRQRWVCHRVDRTS